MLKNSYMSKFDLAGKTAIVTGGAGLLGKYFCYALADCGANVVIADINKQSAQLLAKELEIEKLNTQHAIVIVHEITAVRSVTKSK